MLILVLFSQCLVEATSGNASIYLAFITTSKEYKLKLDSHVHEHGEETPAQSIRHRTCPLPDAADGVKGLLDKATEILKKMPNSYIHE
jgi:cysteine synthase